MDAREKEEETSKLEGVIRHMIHEDPLNITERAYHELKEFRHISTALIMKRYKLTEDKAARLCHKICLIRHLEARALAKEVEYTIYG